MQLQIADSTQVDLSLPWVNKLKFLFILNLPSEH